VIATVTSAWHRRASRFQSFARARSHGKYLNKFHFDLNLQF